MAYVARTSRLKRAHEQLAAAQRQVAAATNDAERDEALRAVATAGAEVQAALGAAISVDGRKPPRDSATLSLAQEQARVAVCERLGLPVEAMRPVSPRSGEGRSVSFGVTHDEHAILQQLSDVLGTLGLGSIARLLILHGLQVLGDPAQYRKE